MSSNVHLSFAETRPTLLTTADAPATGEGTPGESRKGSEAGQFTVGVVGPTTEKWTMESGLTEGGRGRRKLVSLDPTGEARSGRLPEVAMMEAADFGNLDNHAEFRRLDWPPVGRILVERKVSASSVIVREVAS